MILEGIVTTRDAEGALNVAPMGPIVDESMAVLRLRPYQTSHTFRNLQATGCGVFHVVDDVLLLARAAIDRFDSPPATFPAKQIDGAVLADACRWYEFEIVKLDATLDRAEIEAKVLHVGRIRDFFGFNRAKHAVIEAAILATRIRILPREEILRQLAALEPAVQKTAGPREVEAFELVSEYIHTNTSCEREA